MGLVPPVARRSRSHHGPRGHALARRHRDGAVAAWPITWVVDHLVGANDPSTVSMRPIAVFALVAFAVPALGGVFDARLQLAVARISRKATVRIRADVFEHIQRLEYPRHDRHFSGDLIVRLMGDVNMVRDLLFSSWLTLASRGMLLVGSAAVFAFVDWRLLLLALVPLPLLSLDMRRTSVAVRQASGRSRKKEERSRRRPPSRSATSAS
ncbi:MAG: ABC transporter transmembrane domain-containing protein [Ilumatobacteraceae bacterium]